VTTVETGTERMLANVEDGIGWMTFNQPEKHNAMSMDMLAAVPTILDAFGADEDVRVVVVQGAGDRAFISGADISEFGERRTTPEARAAYDRAMADTGRAWNTFRKPTIAMIKGWCMGGGMLTAMQCDMRIAADDSQFGIPAARLGLGYGFGGVETLSRLVGSAHAAEILFSARRFDASEALAIGLVNRVVPRPDLESAVRELASAIAANAPLTVQATKAALLELKRPPADRDMNTVNALVEACFRSEDYVEGQRAFLEKRPPVFRGR
jgi:enoyl-CoA hydratase/carnithine racemase